MNDFCQQHPDLTLLLIAIVLMANAWINYDAGLRFIGLLGWFFGGFLGGLALSWLAMEYLSSFGFFRWPVAAPSFSPGCTAFIGLDHGIIRTPEHFAAAKRYFEDGLPVE